MVGHISLLRTQNFFLYWLPPWLGTAAILTLSGDWGAAANTLGLVKWLLSCLPFLTPEQVLLIHGYLRKAGHAVTYGVLYFLWFRAYQGHLHYSLKKAFLWSLGVCLMVALLDEGHQAMLPFRTGRLADVVLDSAGSTLGAMITFAFWTPRSPATPPRR
jgi:VanZ family protein